MKLTIRFRLSDLLPGLDARHHRLAECHRDCSSNYRADLPANSVTDSCRKSGE